MTTLILGSSGQIGSALTLHLESNNIPVLRCDLADGTNFDLRKPSQFLDDLFAKASFVHFLAFDVGGSTYLQKYQNTPEFISNNIQITNTVFTYLSHYQTPFVFASTQMSNMSHSPYAVLKKLGEHYTNSLNGRYVKFWNTYGYEPDPLKTHVITDFLLQARSHGCINCKTSGNESRQFLHTSDCSRALSYVQDHYEELKHIPLDITSHTWSTIRDVAYKVSSLYDCPVNFSLQTDQVQQDAKNEPSTDFLKHWRPEIDLDTGIRLVDSMMSAT